MDRWDNLCCCCCCYVLFCSDLPRHRNNATTRSLNMRACMTLLSLHSHTYIICVWIWWYSWWKVKSTHIIYKYVEPSQHSRLRHRVHGDDDGKRNAGYLVHVTRISQCKHHTQPPHYRMHEDLVWMRGHTQTLTHASHIILISPICNMKIWRDRECAVCGLVLVFRVCGRWRRGRKFHPSAGMKWQRW